MNKFKKLDLKGKFIFDIFDVSKKLLLIKQ